MFYPVILLATLFGKKSLEKGIEGISEASKNPLFSLEKVYCYSNANAISKTSSRAMWNLDISQYTDIALFLKIHNENETLTQELLQQRNAENISVVEQSAKTTISELYIDHIRFSNTSTGHLSFNYQPFSKFGKIEDENLTEENVQSDKITFTLIANSEDVVSNTSSNAQIDKNLTIPITLRYLNRNIQTDYTISNITEPLTFDGSLLKRSYIPISSIQNTVSFTIHIKNGLGDEYVYQMSLTIPLQNEENTKSIYDGSYTEEKELTNQFFLLNY